MRLIREKFINYSCYIHYMDNSTIQISKEMKDKLASFGSKHDTFESILRKIYSLAVKEQLREFLMSEDHCISIDEALKEAKKKWAE